jgi:alpha-glucosidase
MRADDVRRAVSKIENIIQDGWICWANSNHDFKRVLSRLDPPSQFQTQAAKTLIALGLCLRGSYCLYQGEELGLPEAKLAFEELQDPWGKYLYPQWQGRDGCRTPMPWDNKDHAGFSTVKPWLPIAHTHIPLNVSLQDRNAESVLNMTRAFLHWRKNQPALIEGTIEFIDTEDETILAFARTAPDQNILCVFNLGADENTITLAKGAIDLEGYSFAIATL